MRDVLLLHKLLPLLLLPPGIGLLLVLAGLLLRRYRIAWAGLALLWVFSLPVVGDALMGMVEGTPERLAPEAFPEADAIVVAGGMLEHVPGAGSGEWGEAADRFEAGVELWHAGRAPLLVFMAGRLPWQQHLPLEGSLLLERARRLGVPGRALRVSGEVGNTADEAGATRALLGQSRRIILVTSAFHMPRASHLFERKGFEVIPCRVDFRSHPLERTSLLSFLPSPDAMQHSFLALRELLGRCYYRLRG